MKIRMAKATDALKILQIYSQYIDTKTTFEDRLPTVEEFALRIADTLKTYPYLVCEENECIIAYAYAHPFRERADYLWSVELSVYVDYDFQSKGLGKWYKLAIGELENTPKEIKSINAIPEDVICSILENESI